MDKRKPAVQSSWRLVPLLAVSLLGIGVLYYRVARPPSQQPMFTGIGLLYDAAWGNVLGGSLPSFVHALSLLLLLGFWLRNNRVSRQIAVLWYSINLLVLLAIECALGTTTFYDGLAIVLTLPLALTVLRMFSVTTAVTSNPNYRLPVLMLCIYSGLGVASYSDGYYGSCARYDDEGNCVERIQTASPIYMSYAELRSSVRQEEARPMDDVGRIYAFQNLLYINERNRGIHVIDNADPFDPKPVRFINIPGNLDIEIRGTRLYADSFIDLVTLDISDTDSIVEVDRQVDVFAWDENQNIPYNIELYEDEVDRNLGVIIAYEVN